MGQQLGMKAGLERPDADQRPEAVHPGRAAALSSRTSASSLLADRGRGPFGQQPLGDVAVVDVRAAQELDQLVVARLGQVEPGPPRRLLVPHAVEPALEPVDAGGVAVGVLVAVIAVVPVEDVEAAVGPGLLRRPA